MKRKRQIDDGHEATTYNHLYFAIKATERIKTQKNEKEVYSNNKKKRR